MSSSGRTSSVAWVGSPSTFAGAGAGLVSSIITCPLDVIKTRLQAQKSAKGRIGYLGVIGTVKHIYVQDGLKGYYRGLGPTVLGYIPTWAIYFSVYDGLKQHFGEGYGEHSAVKSESMAIHVSAAMTAGATGSLLTHPVWVVKTRVMTQPAHEVRYRHTVEAFTRIYREEGMHAFYRGLIPSLLGVSHVAVQFPLYEELKLGLADRRNVTVPELSSMEIFICSSISKMVATVITYPHEVVRTRLQIDYSPSSPSPSSSSNHPHPAPTTSQSNPPPTSPEPHPSTSTPTQSSASSSGATRKPHALSFGSMIDTTRIVLHESGWRGLYRGLSVNLLRTVPSSVITLVTYEQLMRWMFVGGPGHNGGQRHDRKESTPTTHV